MKKIMWENWNEKEIELVEPSPYNIVENAEEMISEQLSSLESSLGGMPMFSDMGNLVHTPFGMIQSESALKPSDRWECWLGYTNFDLTHKVSDKMKFIKGVEALKVMSRYTFCVGVGKMFNFSTVRKDIENAICK
jgi:hypothetical protein